MAIKRFYADADNTITNAYKSDNLTRATNANMGQSDILESFQIYGRASTSSIELSRILIKFPIEDIKVQLDDGKIPSGSSYYLRMFDAPNNKTTPRGYDMNIIALSRSWNEGRGLDMETFLDTGSSNWISSSDTVDWTAEGGDYYGTAFTAAFDLGYEDLEIDVTSLVTEWLDELETAGTGKPNYGVIVKLSEEFESASYSTYTKEFFARGTEYFFKKPHIEVRYNDSVSDDRGSFYSSSPLASTEDNTNSLYLYNSIRGQFKDIPSHGPGSEIYVQIYDQSAGGTLLTPTVITGGHISTGIYSASLELNTTKKIVYDRWFDSTLLTCYHTGSVKINSFASSDYNPNPVYVNTIQNMKPTYRSDEIARFRMFTRFKDWCPTNYVVSTKDIETIVITDAYYKVFRIVDNYDAVNYGTGSDQHTKISYDADGNYFNFDMSVLEPNYQYGIKFLFYVNGRYQEQKETFKFRVEKGLWEYSN